MVKPFIINERFVTFRNGKPFKRLRVLFSLTFIGCICCSFLVGHFFSLKPTDMGPSQEAGLEAVPVKEEAAASTEGGDSEAGATHHQAMMGTGDVPKHWGDT